MLAGGGEQGRVPGKVSVGSGDTPYGHQQGALLTCLPAWGRHSPALLTFLLKNQTPAHLLQAQSGNCTQRVRKPSYL